METSRNNDLWSIAQIEYLATSNMRARQQVYLPLAAVNLKPVSINPKEFT